MTTACSFHVSVETIAIIIYWKWFKSFDWLKSSYPFGSCPNLELWHHHRILKTHIRHYELICSYIENTYTTLWRHTNLCCLCQMRENTNGRLLQGKVLQIQINNKTIIEFGSRRIWGVIKASVCVICLITQTFALIIPHILLDLIQQTEQISMDRN